MLFVSELSRVEIISLQWMARKHPLSWSRIRSTAVILSDKKMPLQDIASISSICRQTASIWLMNWETKGICGLVDASGRRQHSTIAEVQEIEVIDMVTRSPRSLSHALAEIHKRGDITLSKSSFKNPCKKAGLSWKRVRKSLRGKRDDDAFNAALNEIKILCGLPRVNHKYA